MSPYVVAPCRTSSTCVMRCGGVTCCGAVQCSVVLCMPNIQWPLGGQFPLTSFGQSSSTRFRSSFNTSFNTGALAARVLFALLAACRRARRTQPAPDQVGTLPCVNACVRACRSVWMCASASVRACVWAYRRACGCACVAGHGCCACMAGAAGMPGSLSSSRTAMDLSSLHTPSAHRCCYVAAE